MGNPQNRAWFAQKAVEAGGWRHRNLICLHRGAPLPPLSPVSNLTMLTPAAPATWGSRQDVGEHLPRDCDLGYLEREVIAHG
jgi:hypothetical protein